MAVISMKQLLEAGVHFGHQTRRCNPKMAPYIYTERNGIYIIDLQKTVKKLEEAYNFVREISAEGGNILFVGGHTPGPAYRGKLGAGLTVEQGYDGARQACLNCLADVKAVIGDLDKVKRVAKLLCMVNSAPDFGQHPLVANGATDLLRQLYGDAGAHARSAVGLAALPNGACIEIEMILEVED